VSVLSRGQVKKLDMLFYRLSTLDCMDRKAEALSRAINSVDPTARTAVCNLSGVEDTEPWFAVIKKTWERYPSCGDIGTAMRRRYYLKESAETTCIMEHISLGTYFKWRSEFLLFAALAAAEKGILIKK
jgi:hypothetical protein